MPPPISATAIDRFLPDKAIDLVDEAASRVSIELTSVPTETDEVERRIKQLEIEHVAVAKDETATDRREQIERERAELREQASGMRAQWEREKEQAEGHGKLRERLDQARVELERAERELDYQRAAELRHGEIPTPKLAAAESRSDEPEHDLEPAVYLSEKVDVDEVAEVVGKWTGIPVTRLMEGEVELIDMEERACTAAWSARRRPSPRFRRAAPFARRPQRPRPPDRHLPVPRPDRRRQDRAGARAGRVHVRLAGRDGADRHVGVHGEVPVSRLVGAPPGYVGYEEGGQLTEAVRRRPYSVVLLDEIEKAHNDVFNVLLQVMDDSRLTDGQGRTVDFKNTVLIMTSNIPGGREGALATFKPEFINRLDDIVEFEPLTRAAARDRRPAGGAADRPRPSAASRSLTDAARDLLGDIGYDPTYGARPLKRVISKRLVDPLALGLLKGEIAAGDRIEVDAADGELTFNRVPVEAPAAV